MRIVDDLTWQRVQARLKEARDKSHPNTLAKRGRPPKYLLSGLMVCGECGANYIMHDARAYGCSGHTNGGTHLCNNKIRVRREIAEAALLANIKNRLLADDMTAYVEKQFRAALRDIGPRDDGQSVESELEEIQQKIGKVLDAIESVGISDALAQRLRTLEVDKADAEQRLQAAQIDRDRLDTLPELVPALMRRWRALVAKFEALTTNPNIEPGEIDTARGHLHALPGQVTLKPKDGVLWAYPALNAKGLAEASPLHIKVVAGARYMNYMQIEIEPFPLVA